jgi:hypothetical protein
VCKGKSKGRDKRKCTCQCWKLIEISILDPFGRGHCGVISFVFGATRRTAADRDSQPKNKSTCGELAGDYTTLAIDPTGLTLSRTSCSLRDSDMARRDMS